MSDTPGSASKKYTDRQIISFILILCLVCGLLLALAAYGLKDAQEASKDLDRSKQMLIAANIMDPRETFQILQGGELFPANYDASKRQLIATEPGVPARKATDGEIRALSSERIAPLLIDSDGNVFTLEEKGIHLPDYLAENKKVGYAALPLKLIYAILPNSGGEPPSPQAVKANLSLPETFVVPVSGFGLWAPIYGYLAIMRDGETVLGTTWYEHAETPGLGANITEAWWQKQFFGKSLFQSSSGHPDLQTAPIGIIVVKGKVKDVFGTSGKADSAVDGLSGATLTGDGVTAAYKNSISPYRAFLIKVHELSSKESTNG